MDDIYTPSEVQEIQALRISRKQALWDHHMAKTERDKSQTLRRIRNDTKRLYELTGLPAYSWVAK